MSKNPRDQIDKASWLLTEGIKDAVSANIMAAAPKLEIKGEALNRLLSIVGASIEEGYHRGHRVFGKSVDKALEEATLPPLEKVSKKKSG